VARTDEKTLEDNKALVRRFFQHLYDGELDEAIALLDPNGTNQQMMHRKFWPDVGWQVPEGAGPYPIITLEAFQVELKTLGEGFDCATFKFVVDELIAEGDRVVATVHNEGQYPDGSAYEMAYCFIVRIRDGIMVDMIEFADTHYGFANREGVGTLNMDLAAREPEKVEHHRSVIAGSAVRQP
jgi:ketosteroid isomerase-like protein